MLTNPDFIYLAKNIKWRYLDVPYHLFQQSAPGKIEELLRACEPSLKALIEEAETRQQQLPLIEATQKTESEELFADVLRKAGIKEAPAAIEGLMRQAVQLLDYAVKAKMSGLGHPFQVLFRPLDDYSIQILVHG